MSDDSDSMPLGGEDLSPDERRALRRMIRDEERAQWAWKKLRLWVPIVGSSLYGLLQLWDHLRKVKS